MYQFRFGWGGFLHEIEASSDADGLHPGVDLELLKTTGNVIADGGAADQQLPSDFVGAVSDGEVAQHLELAPGQRGLGASPLQLILVRFVRDHCKHTGAEDRLDEMDQLRPFGVVNRKNRDANGDGSPTIILDGQTIGVDQLV